MVVKPTVSKADKLSQLSITNDVTLITKVLNTLYQSNNFKDDLKSILTIIKGYLQCNLIEIWIPYINLNTIKLLHYELDKEDADLEAYMKKSLAHQYENEDYTNTPVWKTKTLQWLQLTTQPNVLVRQQYALDSGISTVVAVPIINNDEPIAVIYAYFKTIINENKHTNQLLQICSKQLAIHIQHGRLNHLVNNYLNNAADILAITDYAGQVQAATNSYYKKLQFNKDEKQPAPFCQMGVNRPFELNETFITNNITSNHKFYDITYALPNNDTTTISWGVTVVETEKLIIFSGTDVTEKVSNALKVEAINKQLLQNNAELNAILSNTHELIFKLDSNGIVTYANHNTEYVLGYTKAEMVGKPITYFAHINEIDKVYATFANSLLTGETVKNFIHRSKTKEGTYKWFNTCGHVVLNQAGQFDYIMCLSNDVTEQYHITQLQLQQGDKYKNYFINHPLPLIICDVDTQKIVEVNRAACEKYGYDSQEFLTLTSHNLKAVSNSTVLFAKDIQEEKTKQALKGIYTHKTKGGSTFTAKVSYNQIMLYNRLAVVFCIEDISKELEIQEAYKNANNRYELFVKNSNDSIFRFEATKPIPINLPKAVLITLIEENLILAEANEIFATRYNMNSAKMLIGLSLKDVYSLQSVDYLPLLNVFIDNKFELNNLISTSKSSKGNTYTFSSNIKGHVENGQLIRYWGTSKNITQQQQTLQALQESNVRYESFLETTSDIVFRFQCKTPVDITLPVSEQVELIKSNFYISDISNAILTKLGLKNTSDIIGSGYEFLANIFGKDLDPVFQQLIENNYELKNIKMRHRLRGGGFIAFICSLRGHIKSNQLIGTWGTARDVTELHIESTKNNYLSNIIENVDDAIFTLDEDFNTLTWNEGAKKIFDLTANQVIGKNINEIVTITYDGTTWQEVIAQIQATSSWSGQYSFINPITNKQKTLLATNNKVILNDNTIRYVVISKDITEKIKAEVVNDDNESRFEILASSSPLLLWLVTEFFGNNNYYNRTIQLLLGATNEQINEKGFISYIHPDDVKKCMPIFKDALDKRIPFEVEFRLKTSTGLYVTVKDYGVPRYLKNGTYVGYIGYCTDLTDNQTLLNNLKESETRFKNIANNAPVMMWETNGEGVNVFYSKKLLQFTGNTLAKQINTHWSILIHPADRTQADDTVKGAMARRRPYEIEYKLLHRSGAYKWIIDRAVPRFLPDGTFNGYVGICLDINESKLAVEKIKESESRFVSMADQAPVMFWMTDENDKSIYFSQGWLTFTGTTFNQEIKNQWKDKIHPDDKLNTLSNYFQAIDNKQSFVLEYRYKNAAGDYIWLLDKGTPRYLPNNTFIGYIGIATEINNLKVTQEKLRLANEKFNLINEATNEAIWDSDLVTGITNWGRGFKRLFGYEQTTVNHQFWLSRIHPDDRDNADNLFTNLLQKDFKSNNTIHHEYRFMKVDGTYAMVYEVAYIVLNEQGLPMRILGSIRDITTQKQMEEQLLQTEIDKQISINKAVIEGQEKEKLELSQELHDNINQLISSSKLYMEVAKRQTEKPEMIEKSIETLNLAIQEIRRLSKSLNPSTLEQLTLVDAIENLIDDIYLTGKLNIKFDYTEFNYEITLPQLNLYLYRIVQEQVNNIIKYAKTTTAYITLKNNAEYLYLKIEDNGIGFNPNEKRKGIGLTNIKNRVALFKGLYNIDSSPGNGCIIEINIPLNINYF